MRHLWIIALFALCLLTCSAFVKAQVVTLQEQQKTAIINQDIAKVQSKKAENNKGYIVYIGNKQAIWFVKDLEEMTSQTRADIMVDKFTQMLTNGVDPYTIKPIREGKYTYLQAGEDKFLTVDETNAKAVGVSVHELAYTWANNTRIAMGATPLRKDYSDISRGFNGKESRYLGQTTTGIASWYGAPFHGRRSSDGSRYNKEEFTAAHKTYPFGTLIKVTNLRNSKSCVVKITDRGPYVEGRIIDLSKRAAEEIGMLGSGITKVKLEVVGQY